jgi:nucleotide-binding universal stress UspA family protein
LGAVRPGLVADVTPAVLHTTVAASSEVAPLAAAATTNGAVGPVLIAYDGSDRAKFAIERAASQLAPGREALVVCAWRPVGVGFQLADGQHIDADDAQAVQVAAQETAARGAALANAAGFRAESIAVEEVPVWQGIVETARDRGASLIVLGTHRRSGVAGHLFGSVATEVMRHSAAPVLIVHEPA